MTPRGGAKPGDALYVTGTLGDAALGLTLRRDPAAAARWGLQNAEAAHLASRYLRPRPRLALAWGLREYASAAMDISDGLLIDLTRMCRASGCGARIESGCLPLSDAARRAVTAEPEQRRAILAGGDDYEILIALPPEAEEPMQRIAAQMGVDVARIGRTMLEQHIWLDGAPLSPAEAMRGYRHFS
jgi:thiamine-monophosphate kinase